MKLTVLDAATLGFGPDAWEEVAGIGDLVLHDSTAYDSDTIVEAAADAEVALTNKVPFDAATLERLPRLKLISVLATGYNIIDLEAARERGVTVCNVPAYSTDSVAQHSLALLLELCNHVGLHTTGVHDGDWVRSPQFAYWERPVRELTGLNAGLVGLGAIGRKVGALLQLLGVTVRAHTPSRRDPPAWPGFEWLEIDELFASSDVVSLHCPQTPETTGLVNAERLALMKPDALLVNTARGGLVDEGALAAALREGRIGGAAVDVVSQEPMRADNPLLGAPNCIITPHLAWASETSRRRLLRITAENIRSFLGGSPQNRVG